MTARHGSQKRQECCQGFSCMPADLYAQAFLKSALGVYFWNSRKDPQAFRRCLWKYSIIHSDWWNNFSTRSIAVDESDFRDRPISQVPDPIYPSIYRSARASISPLNRSSFYFLSLYEQILAVLRNLSMPEVVQIWDKLDVPDLG